MRKILISTYNFGLGGIEKSLINLMEKVKSSYDIDVIVQKENDFYETNGFIKKKYTVSNNKNIFLRKIENMSILLKYYFNKHNKYDVSVSYTTSNKVSALIALISSKNSILWVHSNYYYYYNKDVKAFKKFFKRIKTNKFKKIIFVSEEAKKDFDLIYPKLSSKTIVINNQVDSNNIIKLSKEPVDEKIESKYFLFVGRLEERAKKISRIIEAFKLMKKNGYKDKLLIIGSGPDKDIYMNLIKKYKLENTVKMLGEKKNPYPYYLNSLCVLLSSDYEGFPVTYLESLTLNIPIITTIDVSSGLLKMKDYATICDKNSKSIYNAITNFINNKHVNKKFDVNKYNEVNLNIVKKLFDGDF